MAKSKILIKPSKRGTFTAAAKRRGKGVQAFASQVMANPGNYSPAMRKKANFARNAAKWKKADGGVIPEFSLGGDIFSGAASGAAAGTAVLPGWGTLAGAVVGGVSGAFSNSKEKQQQELQQQQQSQNRIRQQRFGEFEADYNYQPVYQDGGEVKIDSVFNANRKVPFVDRILRGDTTSLQIPGVSGKSTHYMASGDNYMFPTVQQTDKGLEYFGDKAFDRAIETGDYLKFDTPEQAAKAAINYKDSKAWENYTKGKSTQYPNGGEVEGKIGRGTQYERYLNQPVVSQDYRYRFPNIKEMSKIANEPGKQFEPKLQTERDSAYFYPLLNKLEDFVATKGQKNLSSIQQKHINSLVNVASRPSYFMKRQGQDALPEDIPSGVRSLQELIGASNQEELDAILGTDYTALKGQGIGKKIKTAKSLIPEGAKTTDIIKAGAYLGTGGLEDDFGSLLDLANYQVDKLGLREESKQEQDEFKNGGTVAKKKTHKMPDGTIHPGATHADYLAGNYAHGGKTGEYPLGGLLPYPNAELEGGESFETPQGENFNVEGPNHANGGIDLNLQEGTRIFSDRLKNPETGNTFSDDNKKLAKNINKYQTSIDDPSTTRLDKKTAMRNLANFEGRQDQLFNTQQKLNGDKQGMPKEYFQDGGTVTADQLRNLYNSFYESGLKFSEENTKSFDVQGRPTREGNRQASDSARNRALAYIDSIANDPDKLASLYDKTIAAPGMATIADTLGLTRGLKQPTPPPALDIPDERSAFRRATDAIFLNEPAAQGTTESTPVPGSLYNELNPPIAAPDYVNPSRVTQGVQAPAAQVAPAATAQPTQDYTLPPEAIEGERALEPWMTDSRAFLNQPTIQTRAQDIKARTLSGDLAAINKTAQVPLEKVPTTTPPTATPGFGGIGGIANAAATLAPALVNIGEGLFGTPEQLDPSNYMNFAGQTAAAKLSGRQFNIDPQLEANRRIFAGARRNLETRTRGEQLAGSATLGSAQAQADAALYGQKQNIENQYIGQGASLAANVGAQDAAMNFRLADYNARNRAAQRNLRSTGLSQLSNITQQRSRDRMQMGALRDMLPRFAYDTSTGRFNYKPTV